MRRVVTGLFLILVFSCLQFGKMAVFIICTWQNTGETAAPCDCEKHLISLNGDERQDPNTPVLVSGLQSVKEFPPPYLQLVRTPVTIVDTSWPSVKVMRLPDQFLPAPFHPPAA